MPHELHTPAVDAAAHRLRRVFGGPVYLAGDAAYDAARQPWNRNLDPRPAIVAEAAGPNDVAAAVLTAREHGLPFAVQATGHGTVVGADGGLLLKTTRLASVRVDPDQRVVWVGAGALWDQVIGAAAPFGLAPLSGTSPRVGVAGYTLGGGIGWLSRAYGFAADSLLEAEAVTADGRLLVASASEHPDLWWALRGGGGNFGVATALKVRLYPAAQVYAGLSLHPIGRAAQTLARYRQWAASEPDRLHTAVMLLKLPVASPVPEPLQGQRVLALRAVYLGDGQAAERLLRPLRAAAGPPLAGGFRQMRFAETSTISAPPPPPQATRQHLDLFRELPDQVIDTLVEAAGDGAQSPVAAVEVRHWGGAMARPGPDAGPVGHRAVPFSVNVQAGNYQADGAQDYLDDLAARLRPHATGGSFLNFLTDPTKTHTAYTPADYRRLARLKRAYDPDNVFHRNHNIPPMPPVGPNAV